MIQKLMASSALLALLSVGAISVAQADDAAMKPAVTAAATNTADAAAKDKKLVPDTATLATAFIGRSVYASDTPDSDNIGDVNDLIIDNKGAITDAVVGVGGFLGIGEKNVAVPFEKLKVVESNGEIRLIYSATRQQLEDAPAVDLAQYDPAARYSEKQAAMNAAQPDAMNRTLRAPGHMAAAPSQDMTAAPANQQMAETTATAPADAGFLSAANGQIRASTVMGKTVYGPDDKSIGEVSDLVLEKEGGTRAALIDVGGFLGIGSKTVAIPFNQLQFSQTANDTEPKVTVAMAKDQLEQLPAYKPMDRITSVPQPADNNIAAQQPADQKPADQMAANPKPMTTGSIDSNGHATFAAQQISASELIGKTVYGTDDTNLGEVSDVVFNKSGDIDAVVVDVGGFLGIGEKPVALDINTLNFRVDEGGNLIVSADATKDQLNQAPTYQVSMK